MSQGRLTPQEGEAAAARIASVYYEAHTFFLVPANTENKFSDDSTTTAPFPSHQHASFRANQDITVFVRKSRDCCMYFPKYSNLTNLKKTDVIFHSPAQYKMSPILILSKKFSCDCKHLGKMRRWHNRLKALQKKTRKSPPGHGRIKKFSSVQKERKKAVINVALQLPDIQTASSYSLIL